MIRGVRERSNSAKDITLTIPSMINGTVSQEQVIINTNERNQSKKVNTIMKEVVAVNNSTNEIFHNAACSFPNNIDKFYNAVNNFNNNTVIRFNINKNGQLNKNTYKKITNIFDSLPKNVWTKLKHIVRQLEYHSTKVSPKVFQFISVTLIGMFIINFIGPLLVDTACSLYTSAVQSLKEFLISFLETVLIPGGVIMIVVKSIADYFARNYNTNRNPYYNYDQQQYYNTPPTFKNNTLVDYNYNPNKYPKFHSKPPIHHYSSSGYNNRKAQVRNPNFDPKPRATVTQKKLRSRTHNLGTFKQLGTGLRTGNNYVSQNNAISRATVKKIQPWNERLRQRPL